MDHSESRGSGCPTLTKSPTAATDQSRLHCKVTKADSPAGRLPNSLPSCLLTIWPSSLILRLSLFKDPLKGTEALLGFSKGPSFPNQYIPKLSSKPDKEKARTAGISGCNTSLFLTSDYSAQKDYLFQPNTVPPPPPPPRSRHKCHQSRLPLQQAPNILC